MNLICRLFGHRTPYDDYRPGFFYMKVRLNAVDGIGRQHASVYAECKRCGEEFFAGMIHVPKWSE